MWLFWYGELIKIFRKRIDAFWSVGISSIWVLAHFESKIHNDSWTISSFHVPNYFNNFQYRYYLRKESTRFGMAVLAHFGTKIDKVHKDFLNYVKSLCITLCGKISQYFQIVYYWCTLKAWLSKNLFYFYSSNEQYMTRLFLIDLNRVELEYYPFMIKAVEALVPLMSYLQKFVFPLKQKMSMLKYL